MGRPKTSTTHRGAGGNYTASPVKAALQKLAAANALTDAERARFAAIDDIVKQGYTKLQAEQIYASQVAAAALAAKLKP